MCHPKNECDVTGFAEKYLHMVGRRGAGFVIAIGGEEVRYGKNIENIIYAWNRVHSWRRV